MRSTWTRGIACLLACAVLAFGSSCSDDTGAKFGNVRGAALSEVLNDSDVLHRASRLGSLLSELPPEALPAVRVAFERSSLDAFDPETVLIAHWWARFDPRGALAWSLKDPRGGSVAVTHVLFRTWAHSDPREAWARAMKLPRPASERARAGVLTGWEESDPAGAVAHLRSIGDLVERQRSAEVLARGRVRSLGAAEAFTWLESLPVDVLRSELERRVASEVAVVDPAAAVAWANGRIANAERSTGLPRRLGTRWVRRDPEAAMAWLASLPAGADRDDGVMESFRDWLVRDRPRAMRWIGERELETWLEPAFALYAQRLSIEQPEEALALVARFDDERLRQRMTTTIARVWLRRDFAKADGWVKQAALPEDVRKRIYTKREKRGFVELEPVRAPDS